MKHVFYFLILILVFSGCNTQTMQSQNQAEIIEMVVNSALGNNTELRNQDFWIDFSNCKLISRSAINDFLKSRPNFLEIDSDSLLKNDPTWNSDGYLRNTLLYLKSVEIKGEYLIINLDVVKATDGSNGLEVILKKKKKYSLISTKIESIQ